MTVNTQNITSGPYTGNNTSDVYDYTFRVDDKSELRVFETTAAGVETELTVDVDYTVQDVGVAAGGTVTRLAGNLPTGYLWFIRSNRVPTQNTAFASQGGYFPQIHETALDKLTFLIQQLLELNNRTFRLAESDPNTENVNLMLPPVLDRANRTLVFDGEGNLAVGAALGTLRGAWQAATLYFPRDIFVDAAGTGNVYQVLVEHTSTNITDDLAADKIEVFIDIEIATDAATAALAAQTAAETAQGLAEDAEIGAVSAKDAAEAAAALFTKASTAQAEAGTDDVNYMTSLKTKQAIDANVPFASSAENIAGTVEGKAVDPLGIREAFNASGAAPVYACRAWGVFTGTGTVTLLASGNISSITDHGSGSYSPNFTTSMPDGNYAVGCSANSGTGGALNADSSITVRAVGAGGFNIQVLQSSVLTDAERVSFAVFR